MREFLKGLGLDPKVVNSIMAEYGKNITKFREERDNLKKEKENLETKVSELETNNGEELETFKKSVALEKALASSKAKDTKLLQTLINSEKLEYEESNGEYSIKGLDDQLKEIKGTHGYLFEEDKTKEPTMSLGGEHTVQTPTSTPSTLMDALKEKYNN